MILFEKFGQHQPLNRQSERYAREGIDLSVSTLADQVGACALLLQPLHALIEAHVLGAERLHGDDTTVPILAKVKTITGRIWTYVRDDRPFGGRSPPAALYYASCDRRKEHPEHHLRGFTGILQADAYSGYNGLYDPSRCGQRHSCCDMQATVPSSSDTPPSPARPEAAGRSRRSCASDRPSSAPIRTALSHACGLQQRLRCRRLRVRRDGRRFGTRSKTGCVRSVRLSRRAITLQADGSYSPL